MVLSVAVRVGIPGYLAVSTRAEAARAAADLDRVRQAVTRYRASSDRWPVDYGPGLVPPELTPYLGGLVFNRPRYRLDWQNWPLPDGLPGRPHVRAVLALSVETEDLALGAALIEALGSDTRHFLVGNTYTFVLALD
jgi:hypothetical protein